MEKDTIAGVVMIGGSAGSLEVILQLVPVLPSMADIVYIIVVHRRSDAESLLQQLITARTTMPVSEVEDKEPILPNHIYIAPAGYHLLAEDRHYFSLDGSEKIHYSRPSIDVSFESFASVFGNQVCGIILSGANEDGAEGLQSIVSAGGRAWIQDPHHADFPVMPLRAMEKVAGAEVMGVEGMVERLKAIKPPGS